MNYYRHFALLLLGLFVISSSAAAQQVNLGADLVSRYVWRGYDFGESVSLQPTLEVTAGKVTVGSWGSYAISQPGASASEHDLYVSADLGAAEVGVTDYYFPGPGAKGFFNLKNGGDGAHVIEPYAAVSLGEVDFYGAVNAYNDPDHSAYLEASYPFSADGTELSVTAGAVPYKSGYYGTNGFALVNLSFSASRAVSITDQFELPLSVTYTLNPDTERTFLVFGISL